MDVDKTPHNSSYIKFVCHESPSQRPHLDHFSSSHGFNIVDVSKLTKPREMSDFNLTTINFDSIDICDVKYLPPSFNDDVLFILPPINMGIPSTYGCSMDDIDKMCDKYPWCITKIINI